MRHPITIVAVSDNHYLILLAALIKSIEKNNRAKNEIQFYIIEDKVTESNKRKLESSFSDPLIKISWIKMEEAIPKNLSLPLDRSTYPLNIYMRLFIPYFLPADVKKAIYLDVDMIALEDINTLWNTDLEGQTIGAVHDIWINTVSNDWGGIKNYAELNLDADTLYFNTGLIVFDLEKWREKQITEAVLDCIEANKKYANYPDQYGLNVVLANNWKALDLRWNTFASSSVTNAYIIHFATRKPIYKTYSNNPAFQKLFWEFVNLTKWKGTKPISEGSRYLKKINNVWSKIKKRLF